ncbi:hypothetical protein J2X72_002682 [Phyllobacterium sp. 1468]|nr:hypothetical protein [Phyllobacterium sp. 1468]
MAVLAWVSGAAGRKRHAWGIDRTGYVFGGIAVGPPVSYSPVSIRWALIFCVFAPCLSNSIVSIRLKAQTARR